MKIGPAVRGDLAGWIRWTANCLGSVGLSLLALYLLCVMPFRNVAVLVAGFLVFAIVAALVALPIALLVSMTRYYWKNAR